MAEIMDLPLDVLTNIFIRLPAKYLGQLKTICKLWSQIISSPDFVNSYFDYALTLTQNQTQTPLGNSYLHFTFSSPYLSKANFDTFDNIIELDHPYRKMGHGYVDVAGSCNGLLCLQSCDSSDLPLVLYNPTNRSYRKLPSLSTPLSWDLNYFGLGYDSATRDFKFVRILMSCEETNKENPSWKEVMVYSLRADSWTRVDDFPRPLSPQRKDGVFVHGTLHWVLRKVDVDELNIYHYVVSFSLSDHMFNEVPQPCYEEKSLALHVGALDGCLCLLAGDTGKTDAWIMKEYDVAGSWTRLFRIRQHELFCQWPIAFSANRQELFLQLGVWNVVSVDMKTMAVKDVEVGSYSICLRTHVCVDNLMMLKDANRKKRRRRAGRGKRR